MHLELSEFCKWSPTGVKKPGVLYQRPNRNIVHSARSHIDKVESVTIVMYRGEYPSVDKPRAIDVCGWFDWRNDWTTWNGGEPPDG